MESRELLVRSSCNAVAFFRDIPGLQTGDATEIAEEAEPTPAGMANRPMNSPVQFHGKRYALRIVAGGETPRPRLELLREDKPVATLFEVSPGDELYCERKYLGDLNNDGLIDVVFDCQRNIYERWSGVSLSERASTSRHLVLQRVAGGNI